MKGLTFYEKNAHFNKTMSRKDVLQNVGKYEFMDSFL